MFRPLLLMPFRLLLFGLFGLVHPPIATAQASDLMLVGIRLPPEGARGALLIHDARITAVGSSRTVAESAPPGCSVVDLNGAWVLPGFHDSHVHLTTSGQALLGLKLEQHALLAEIQETLRSVPPTDGISTDGISTDWVVGSGWGYDLARGRRPNRADLDEVLPDRPVFLESYDGHAAWVNSLALERARIGPGTPDPPGGEIVRDPETGRATGLLLEGAVSLVESILPVEALGSPRDAILASIDHLVALGVTSVNAIESDPDILSVYRDLAESGELKIRVWFCPPLDSDLDRYARMRDSLQYPHLRFGWLKAFVDGVIESKTALMLDPYVGSADRGKPVRPRHRLMDLVLRAHMRGFDVGLHAIGDGAVRLALDAYAMAGRLRPDPRRRHRIEHIEVLHPEDLDRFRRLGVLASMQPYHAIPSGQVPETGEWAENLGPARLRRSFPFRHLADAGAILAFGSDFDVMSADPFRGLAVAMTLQNEHRRPPAHTIAQRPIDFPTALNSYTVGSAWGCHAENDLGTLTPGRLADLVVLEPGRDPRRVEDLWSRPLAATLVGGRVRHGSLPR